MVTRLSAGRNSGFTMLEMMIVMIIMGILLSIVLRNDLFELRKLISQYTLDKQKAPQSLEDLVQGGYLKEIPKDPMTHEANWEPKQEDVLLSVDQQDPGIDDVHSASSAMSSDGTAYSTW